MPNSRSVDSNLNFIAIDFEAQFLRGTFEHARSVILDRELDLSRSVQTDRNDDIGAPARFRTALLKVVLCGDSRGLVRSREIVVAGRRDVRFIALSGDSHPDSSAIIDFVIRQGAAIKSLSASKVRRANGFVAQHTTPRNARLRWSSLPLA